MASRAACRIVAAVAAAAVATPRASAFQDTIRVSVDSAGVEANGVSGENGISADGRYVVFTGWATNLVVGDNNQSGDVFLVDRANGTIERLSVDSAGSELQASSYVSTQPASGDGLVVVFASYAAFDPGDTNGFEDVYVRDRGQATTTRASVDSNGVEGDGHSEHAVISLDGRVVAFESKATNLVAGDSNRKEDIFVRDLVTGTTERISVDSSGVEGNSWSSEPSISADGNLVAFTSMAKNLVSGDTFWSPDIFVRDRTAGTTERISIGWDGKEADGASGEPSISADGRFVAYSSLAYNIVAHDGNWRTDIFVHDRATGETTLESVDDDSRAGNGDSVYPSISADGRFVLFLSGATNLVPGDTNKFWDVFLRDREKGTTVRVNVDSSGAEANYSSWPGGVSTNGVASFCSAAWNLVASDNNGVSDIFVHEPCGARANWTNYGAGFPGTHGVPAFTSQQFPLFGATVTVDLANSYGQPTIGFLVLGLQRASLPTKWGGELLVLAAQIAPITFSYSGDSFTGTIPDDLDLCGATLDLQGIEFDPGAQYGLSFSQGLELAIGR